MLSYRKKRIILQLIPFGVIPGIFSIIYSLIEKGILGNHPIYPSTGNPYSFQLLIPATISMLAGFLLGILEIFYINKWFQKSSFIKKLIFKFIIYLFTVIVASIVITFTMYALELGINPFNVQVWNVITTFYSNLFSWSLTLYFTMAILICVFYMEVSDNIGQAVFLNLFRGKYHQPIEEERIFMFLDMKSSTAIAEQLGHVKYFKMLKDFYLHLSDPIIEYGGEIYQYVGDEIVITWKLKKGSAHNSLHCFFAMKQALQNQAKKFQSNYGLVPTFKAAIHYGKVTTGEIGVIKKEIIFSGDVLNTTARIQSLCNTYKVDLLTSEKFVKTLEKNETFNAVEIGEVALKGRNKKINLYTLKKQGEKQITVE